MKHDDEQLNILRRVDGILEFDSINTAEEFVDLMKTLQSSAGVSIAAIASAVQQERRQIETWTNGADVPKPQHWPPIVQALRTLIGKSIAASDQPKQ